jgi:hypothetical protein
MAHFSSLGVAIAKAWPPLKIGSVKLKSEI